MGSSRGLSNRDCLRSPKLVQGQQYLSTLTRMRISPSIPIVPEMTPPRMVWCQMMDPINSDSSPDWAPRQPFRAGELAAFCPRDFVTCAVRARPILHYSWRGEGVGGAVHMATTPGGKVAPSPAGLWP